MSTITALNKWYDDENGVYTRDTWIIPETGTEVWCTGWKRGQTIKPYGDGAHIIVGLTVYHCDEFMSILNKWVKDGEKWGLDGVSMSREQRIDGYWKKVKM